jgi:prophage antirepressor-like protein
MDNKEHKELSEIDMSLEEAINRFAVVRKKELQQGGVTVVQDMFDEGYNEIINFNQTKIRKVFHSKEWFYSLVDIIEALVGTDRPSKYWEDLKNKLKNEEGFELSERIGKFKFIAKDGKKRSTDCGNAETIFRIIQSIPSPKVEPFKRWFAKVAYERIQEIQNPEIAVKRAMMMYKAKGYSDEWVINRVKNIATRKELTDEWQKRGVREGIEYAVLTNILTEKTFGKKVKDYKEYKNLKEKDNLRDHMTSLELALNMLAETTTREMAIKLDAQGFEANKEPAHIGGKVAGDARRSIEKKLGKPVVSNENFLPKKNIKQIG